MDQREDSRAGHRKERHGLGESVDRGSPLLSHQQQNGRDESAGVPNADPPDEVDDRESPADGNVQAPDARALEEQLRQRLQENQNQQEGEPNPTHHQRGVSFRTTAVIWSVTDPGE